MNKELTIISSDSFPLFLRWLVDTKQFEVWRIIDVVEKPYHFNEEWKEFIIEIGTQEWGQKMKQTINEYDFRRAFEQLRPDQFSYQGLGALFDYFEELEDGIGEEIELDVIGICCEYTEYEDLSEFQEDYGKEYKTIEDIEEQTTVIPVFGDSFIIEQF